MKNKDAWWALEDEDGLSDERRAQMLISLHSVSGFSGFSFQGTVECIGRAAHNSGSSFDEALNRYYILYVKS